MKRYVLITRISVPRISNPQNTNVLRYSSDAFSCVIAEKTKPMVSSKTIYAIKPEFEFQNGSCKPFPVVQRGMATSRRCRFSLTGGVSFTALLPRKCMHSPHGREIKRFPTSTNKGNPQSQRPMLMPTSKVKPTAAITVNKLKLKNISENSAPNNKLPFCKSSQPSVFRRIQVLTSAALSPVATGAGPSANSRPSWVVRRTPASQSGSGDV